MAKDRLVTPSYCCILAANFLLYFGFYLLMPVLPFYLTEVFHTGNDDGRASRSPCYTVAALTIRPFSGYLLDTLARKPLYLIWRFSSLRPIFAGYLFAGSLTLVHHPARSSTASAFGTVTVIGQHRGNRHHALIAARRRNRILRPDEQHGDGDRPDGRVVPARCSIHSRSSSFAALTSCSLGCDQWLRSSGRRRRQPVKRAACLARPLHPRSKASRPGSTCCCCLFPTA